MIFRVAETEIMPRLVVGYTELDGGKLKKGKGLLAPNFGVGPKPRAITWKRQGRESEGCGESNQPGGLRVS